jgi:hypothetical protein
MILKTKKDHTLELSHYVESCFYSSQNGLILYCILFNSFIQLTFISSVILSSLGSQQVLGLISDTQVYTKFLIINLKLKE